MKKNHRAVMTFEPFPEKCRKKRTSRRGSGGLRNTIRYYIRLRQNSELASLFEERNLHDPGSPSLSFYPRDRSLKGKVIGKGRAAIGNVTEGVSGEGTAKDCLGASSITCKGVLPKGQNRKAKGKENSTDSVIIVPRYRRLRGQTRRNQRKKTSIHERAKLDSGMFLHYLMHLWNAFPEEKVKSVAYFDPIWFGLYSDEKSRMVVLNWIKEIVPFSKKYVLVPIVLWSHWSLLIFCHLGESLDSEHNTPCMLLLDSLHAIGPKRLEPLIRRLLFDLYKSEERTETMKELKKMRLLIPKVPQQKKGEECGYIVLSYISLFIESAPENFSVSHGYPYFMKKDWFTCEELESFYKKLDSFPAAFSDHDDSASIDSGDCVETIS